MVSLGLALTEQGVWRMTGVATSSLVLVEMGSPQFIII